MLSRYFFIFYGGYYFSEGIENISVTFHRQERRVSWEEAFLEAKQKLGKLCLQKSKVFSKCSTFLIVFRQSIIKYRFFKI